MNFDDITFELCSCQVCKPLSHTSAIQSWMTAYVGVDTYMSVEAPSYLVSAASALYDEATESVHWVGTDVLSAEKGGLNGLLGGASTLHDIRPEIKCTFPVNREIATDESPAVVAKYFAELCASGNEYGWTLNKMIIHLNDIHQFPRTEKDRNEKNEGLPTIYGWLKEQSELHGWDLTCRLPK